MSLSSWESELYAAVSTGVEALASKRVTDLRNNTRVTNACDNQGVVDHTARQGLVLAGLFAQGHVYNVAVVPDNLQVSAVLTPTVSEWVFAGDEPASSTTANILSDTLGSWCSE